jgi:hypothetical protein
MMIKTDELGVVPLQPPCGNLRQAIDNLEAFRKGILERAERTESIEDRQLYEAIAHGMWLAQVHLGISAGDHED